MNLHIKHSMDKEIAKTHLPISYNQKLVSQMVD